MRRVAAESSIWIFAQLADRPSEIGWVPAAVLERRRGSLDLQALPMPPSVGFQIPVPVPVYGASNTVHVPRFKLPLLPLGSLRGPTVKNPALCTLTVTGSVRIDERFGPMFTNPMFTIPAPAEPAPSRCIASAILFYVGIKLSLRHAISMKNEGPYHADQRYSLRPCKPCHALGCVGYLPLDLQAGAGGSNKPYVQKTLGSETLCSQTLCSQPLCSQTLWNQC